VKLKPVSSFQFQWVDCEMLCELVWEVVWELVWELVWEVVVAVLEVASYCRVTDSLR